MIHFFKFEILPQLRQLLKLLKNLINPVPDNEIFGPFKKNGLGIFFNFTRFRKF